MTHQSAGQMLRECFGSKAAVNHKALLGLNLSAAFTLPPVISQMTALTHIYLTWIQPNTVPIALIMPMNYSCLLERGRIWHL